jgi:hypothetical protein
MSGSQPRKRIVFRNLLRPPFRKTSPNPAAPHSHPTFVTSSSHSLTLQPIPISSTFVSQRILDAALQGLSSAQRTILHEHGVAGTHDIRTAVDETYNAASNKKQQCDDKRWRWTFRGKDVVLRDEAEKVILWIDRFKPVGDIAANAAPVYVGLPWAGIRMILEVIFWKRSRSKIVPAC